MICCCSYPSPASRMVSKTHAPYQPYPDEYYFRPREEAVLKSTNDTLALKLLDVVAAVRSRAVSAGPTSASCTTHRHSAAGDRVGVRLRRLAIERGDTTFTDTGEDASGTPPVPLFCLQPHEPGCRRLLITTRPSISMPPPWPTA